MLARFFYAELPRTPLSFASLSRPDLEWAALKKPTFWFVDQAIIQPKLEWAGLRRPTLLFAPVAGPEFLFVPFDVELFRLLEQKPLYLVGAATVLVSAYAAIPAALAGSAGAVVSAEAALSSGLAGSAGVSWSPEAVLAANLRGESSITMAATASLDATLALAGEATVAVGGAADLDVLLGGAAVVSVEAVAALRQLLSGEAAMNIAPSATLRELLRGSAAVQILPTATLTERLVGTAAVSIAPTAKATIGGGGSSVTVNYGITSTNDDIVAVSLGGPPILEPTLPANGSASVPYIMGLRFIGVAVPKGATITTATLTLKKDPSNSSPGAWGAIRGVASDNAPAWATTDPIAAAKTAASVVIADGATQVYDVAAIIQELVNRTGWASGNALAFAGDATGATGLMAWIDFQASAANSAKLAITYSTS